MNNKIQLKSGAAQEFLTNTNEVVIPPRGQRFKNAQISIEEFVLMCDKDYYMKKFCDGSCEFVRFDDIANKWIFLYFPAA